MKPLRGQTIFTLIWLGFAVTLLVLTLDLSPVARLVPFWVLVPTLSLLILELLINQVPALAVRGAFLERRDLLATRALLDRTMAAAGARPAADGNRTLAVLGWYALLLLLILIAGIRWAVPVYTFLYLALRARESILLSLGIAAVMGGLGCGALWMLGAR